MGCFDPVLVRNGKVRTFRNWSLASSIYKQAADLVFDCGKCGYCRRKRSAELAMRCVLHASTVDESCFLTLTYNEKVDGYHNELCYRDIQLFKKRLRKFLSPRKVQIFNVHEFGRKGKKHWHLLVFGWMPSDRVLHTYSNGLPLFRSPLLERLWSFGHSVVGSVEEASSMYMALYTQKDFKNNNLTNGKKSKSNHSGLAKAWFLQNWRRVLTLGFIPFGSKKRPVPRYFEKLAKASPIMQDLFMLYEKRKLEFVKEREAQWDELIRDYDRLLLTDFEKSGENFAYDLSRRMAEERF